MMRIMPGDFTTLLNGKKFHGHGNKEQDFSAVSARPTWTTRDTPWMDIQGVCFQHFIVYCSVSMINVLEVYPVYVSNTKRPLPPSDDESRNQS